MQIPSIITSLIVKIKIRLHRFVAWSKQFIKKRPLTSFLIILGTMFLMIVIGNLLRKPSVEEGAQELATKDVEVYQIGFSPRLTVQGRIEKTGVLTINAQSSGIVTSLNVYQGQTLGAYQQVAYIGSNYYGSNPISVQKQLAKLQHENTESNYPLQKELIAKQRDVADRTDQNSDELRKITEQSIQETKDSISLQESILSTIDSNLAKLEQENADGSNDSLILSTKQLKSQYQNGINQLKSALRQNEYQASGDNPPAALSNLSKDITRINLDLQERALDLGKEVARLNYRLAQVSESILYPASPCVGVVERVYVKQGQQVNPGQALIAVSCNSQEAQVIALVSKDVAQNISRLEASKIRIGNQDIELIPDFVSSEATDGRLFNIHYQLPSNLVDQTIEKEFVSVSIPVGSIDTGSTIPYIPVDAVFQTQDHDQLFVVSEGKALVKEVQLGEIIGNFVQIETGLTAGDQVILNRNVLQGDPVKVK